MGRENKAEKQEGAQVEALKDMGAGRLKQAREEGWKDGGQDLLMGRAHPLDEKWGRQPQQHLLEGKSSP